MDTLHVRGLYSSFYLQAINTRWVTRTPPHPSTLWSLLWKSMLHERHKFFLWRVLHNALPTKDRLSTFISLPHTGYFFCPYQTKTAYHLFLECPISKVLWLKSPWQLNLAGFTTSNIEDWLRIILGQRPLLPLDATEQVKLAQFAVVTMERVWLERNRLLKGHPAMNWLDISASINRGFFKYWKGSS